MAVGYKVICGEGQSVSVLKKIGELRDKDGVVYDYELASEVYLDGAVIPEEEIAPIIVQNYDKEDTHTLSIFQRVSIGNQAKTEAKSEAKPKRTAPAKKESDKEQGAEE